MADYVPETMFIKDPLLVTSVLSLMDALNGFVILGLVSWDWVGKRWLTSPDCLGGKT